MPSLLLSNPLGADDAQRIGLEIRYYQVGEIISVSDYVFATLIRTGYGIPYGTVEDTLLIGDGSPTEATGVDGQWYLDRLNEVLWGPKTGGVWPSDPIRPDRGVQSLRIAADHLIITYSTGTEVDLGNVRGPAGPTPGPATATTQGILRLAGDFGGTADAPTVPRLAELADKIPLSQRGAADGVATLDGGTKVPVAQLPAGTAGGIASLDAGGKIPNAQLPALAITDTFPAANQAAMLALAAQVGDVAIRTDGTGSWILRAEPATTLANWSQLTAPTDAVSSVDGRTGAVDLSDRYLAISSASTTSQGNTIAKRDAAGRLSVVAGSASSDAVIMAQVANMTRDRGTGTTLPTTDLRRGDVYHHTDFDCLLVYTGNAWRQATIPITETTAAPLYDGMIRDHPVLGVLRGRSGNWGPANLSVSLVVTASRTLTLSDAGRIIDYASASAGTLTIPTNATAPLPIGTLIEANQADAGKVSFAGAAGVTVAGPGGFTGTRVSLSTIRARKRGGDLWIVSGDVG